MSQKVLQLNKCQVTSSRVEYGSTSPKHNHNPVFRITSKWTYLRPHKVPNTSKFWDKDVSKRPEFPELRPKFERWT